MASSSTARAIPQEDGQGYKPFTAVVSFIPADPELRSADAWFLEAWIQQEDMERLTAAYRAGEMPSFFVGTKLDLWIRRGDEHGPFGYGVTWHLVPAQRRESSFPEAGSRLLDHRRALQRHDACTNRRLHVA